MTIRAARSTAPADLAPIAIIGGGFSGTLLAIQLARLGARVELIEREPTRLGRGLAYGTHERNHLLNVRASNMSAWPDDPAHFLRWLGTAPQPDGQPLANRFVPRQTYGAYLRGELDALLAEPDHRLPNHGLTVRADDVIGVAPLERTARLTLATGTTLDARAAVLALGNFAPAPLAPLRGLAPPVLCDNPWARDLGQGLGPQDHVLLIGTGLTAVDVVLTLSEAGFAGRITALSRRGLAPRGHALSGPTVAPVPRPTARGAALVRAVRERAAALGDWRAAIDELRPHTEALWRLHDRVGQARFLRHLRPWWDVHRHRLAPPVAERLAALTASGQLRFVAGRVTEATMQGEAADVSADVTWRPRGSDTPTTMRVTRVVLCTGPDGDLARCPDPLLQKLLAAGHARGDAHRLGLEVDRSMRLVGAEGRARDTLFAVGPLTKGEAWEIVAVPDIRRQVAALAKYLTHSHWIGGEGL